MTVSAPHRPPVRTVSIAVASATPKDDAAGNQDRVGVVRTPDGGAAIVCDGVGSLHESGAVAERCLRSATAHLAHNGLEHGLPTCAEHASAELAVDCAGLNGATTLLAVAADRRGLCSFAAVGNGSILVLEELMSPPDRTALGFAEVTIPHVSPEQGGAALRSYLPAGDDRPLEVSLGSLWSSGDTPRLLLACSDGVTTLEDRELGRTSSGLWQPLTAPFAQVLGALAARWDDMVALPDASDLLEDALRSGLERALALGLLFDDASVGAVLVHPAGTAAQGGPAA